jgi:glycosyltransferase involved in cell wall biosynthesis
VVTKVIAEGGSKFSVGVAMCVYNGARYLPDQLSSIAQQTELPQRVVILDDGSTDGSLELLQAWAATAPFEVIVNSNTEKLGVVRNFERACALLQQDIVFLCDQDDIWFPDKVATFLAAFADRPAVALLHSNASLIDADGRPLGWSLFDALLVTPKERELVRAGEAWKVYAKRNLVTGAACAFRRELLDHAVPFSVHWVHDEWLAFIASLVAQVGVIEAPCMSYRLHSGNTVGLPVPTLKWRVSSIYHALTAPTVSRQRARADRLEEMRTKALELGVRGPILEHLELAAKHARFRSQLPPSFFGRLARILQERRTGYYHAWSNGEISMLHDLLIPR